MSLWRDAVVPGVIAGVVASTLFAVVGGVRVLFEAAVVLDPVTWLGVVALGVPATAWLTVPVAAVVGPIAAVRRWQDEGAWIGRLALGLGGRHLVAPVAAWSVAASLLTLAACWWVSPAALRASHDLARAGTRHVQLAPGRALEVGGISVVAQGVTADGWAHEVFLAGAGRVGTVARARVVGLGTGLAVDLRDGVAAPTRGGWHLTWERWLQPLESPADRVELAERPTSEILEVARRSEAEGRSGDYERAVALKRLAHPVAIGLLGMGLLPLGSRRWTWVGLAATGVGYLVVVRLGDALAPLAGAPIAVTVGPAFAALIGLAVWLTWRDR